MVAVDAAVVHVEETPARDALEVFRVPDLPEGLDGVLHSWCYRHSHTSHPPPYTEYEATAGRTARHEPLLVVHLTVEQPLLLEHLGVPQPHAAVGAGEVRLVPVRVTRLVGRMFCKQQAD